MYNIIIEGSYVYELCETGDYLCVGKIINGIDGKYIEWYT